MSRDFELLQRLESGWEQSLHPLPGIEDDPIARTRAALAGSVSTKLYAHATRPLKQVTGEIRNEIQKLVFRAFLSSDACRTVTFTSVSKQDQANWLIACAADALAEVVQKRVCLLDADIDHPSMHQAYSISNRKGIMAATRSECQVCDAAIRVSGDLWIIPAGEPAGNSTYPTISDFRSMLSMLSRHFDYVVINAPDCQRLTELCIVGAASEGAVLLLDAATTHRTSAQEAKSALETSGARLIGSVFYNQQDATPSVFSGRV
jgi:Mrp family chromosome partitioning ATPase